MTTDYTHADSQRLSEVYGDLYEAGELDGFKKVMDSPSCREKVLDAAKEELKQDTEAGIAILDMIGLTIWLILAMRARMTVSSAREIISSLARQRNSQLAGLAPEACQPGTALQAPQLAVRGFAPRTPEVKTHGVSVWATRNPKVL